MLGGRAVLPEQQVRYGDRELLFSAVSLRGLEGEALEQVRRMRTKTFSVKRLIDTGINNTNLTAVVGATYRGEPYGRSEARPWWKACHDLSTERQAISVCEAGSLKVDIVQGISLDSRWPGPPNVPSEIRFFNGLRDHYLITREERGSDGFGTSDGRQKLTPDVFVWVPAPNVPVESDHPQGVMHAKVLVMSYQADILRLVIGTHDWGGSVLDVGDYAYVQDFTLRAPGAEVVVSQFASELVKFFAYITPKVPDEEDADDMEEDAPQTERAPPLYATTKLFVQDAFDVDPNGVYLVMNAPTLEASHLQAPQGSQSPVRVGPGFGALGVHGLEELNTLVDRHCAGLNFSYSDRIVAMSCSLESNGDGTAALELCRAIARAGTHRRERASAFGFLAVARADADKWPPNARDPRTSVYREMRRAPLQKLANQGMLYRFVPKEQTPLFARPWHGTFIARWNEHGIGWVLITSARLTNAGWRGTNAELGVLYVNVEVKDYLPCDIWKLEPLDANDAFVPVPG